MVKMAATQRGYAFGRIIEAGERVEWTKENVPSWLSHASKAAPDQEVADDGDADVSKMSVKELRAYAVENEIDLGAATKKAEILAVIGGDAPAASPEPFAEAPEPVRVENEITTATGGVQPDWVAPQPVTD